MTYIIEVLRQEHCNIESLLRVLERELSVFDRGDRPDYDVVRAVIDYFKDYPDCCHHPKEDMIVEKLKARDPVAAATRSCRRAPGGNEASAPGRSSSRARPERSGSRAPECGQHHS